MINHNLPSEETQPVPLIPGKTAHTPYDIPERWGATTRGFVASFALILLILFLYWVRPLLIPIGIAIAASYALFPMVRWLTRSTRIRHSLSVTIVYIFALIVTVVTPTTLVPVIVRQVQTIMVDVAQFEHQIRALLAEPITVLGTEIQVDAVVADLINSTAGGFTLQTSNALNFLSTTSISFAWLLIILVCTYYFLLDAYKIQIWLVALSPPDTQADAQHLLAEVGRIWQGYVGGTLALIIITATTMSLVYTALGLSGAVPIGVLTGLLVVIPELGPFLAGTLATTTAFFLGSAFLSINTTSFAILIAITHLVFMQIRAKWLQPRLRERYVPLHGGIAFVSILGALVLSGVMAALVIIPTLATLGVLGHYARAKLFGLEPWH